MTWAELQSAIPFRLNRSNLPAAFVLEMLLERIDFYGPQIFVPAETTDYSIVTQPGQFFYRLPAGTQQVNFVRVLYNGVWIPVAIAKHYTDILEADPLQPPFTSLPVSLCRVYGNQIRLFPTPNANYPVELTMMATVAAPTDDQDATNFWVTDGRMLLINAACAEICAEYLDIAVPNSPRIMTYRANEAMALEKLMQQAHQMTSPSVMKQWL
jgi:hypothetical protein